MDSCGPSNGAKSLQRHLAQDRTLQQDTACLQQSSHSAGPAGFRQQEGHAVHQADAAMQAFQQGRDVGPLTRRMPIMGQNAQVPSLQGPPAQQHAWTGDFERHELVSSGQTTQKSGAWGADFLAFQQQQQQQVQQQQLQHQQQNQHQYQYQGAHMNSMVGTGSGLMTNYTLQPGTALQSRQSGMTRTHEYNAEAQARDEAYAAAFKQAEQSITGLSLEEQEAHRAMHQQGHEDGPVFANQDEAVNHMARQEGPLSEEQRRAIDQSMENAALSRIAGDLINAVAADQDERGETTNGDPQRQLSAAMTDKFRNSNFMKLMHALRDGQVALTQDGQGLADTVTGAQISAAEPAIEVPALTEEDHKQIEAQQRRRGEPIYGSKYTFDDSLEAMNDELALSM